MSRRLLAVLAVAALIVTAAVVAVVVTGRTSGSDEAPVASEVVETTSGPVRGIVDSGIRSWRGIPYAAPPVGDLRWRPPAPVEPSAATEVRDGSSYGPGCVQPEPYTFGVGPLTPRPNSSEDCLFLNVNRPDDDTTGLPVLVFVHGGGFFAGNGGGPIFNSPAFVERGVVLVTINYRLGQLGYFAHPALRGDVANFGLLDQIAALEWVRDNAVSFGGDPDRVTVMGSSAGAGSVNALMAMPSAAGLFAGAIAQSAPGDERSVGLDVARERGAAAYPGLTGEELRAMPAADFLSPTFNVIEGDALILDAALPETASTVFAEGREAAVPYLDGSTATEFTDNQYAALGADPAALRDSLGGARHRELVRAYGRAAYDESVLDDVLFTLPAARLAIEHAARAPSYRYLFEAAPDPGHGTELAFTLDSLPAIGGPDSGVGAELAGQIADYWYAFIATGTPSVDGLPAWPDAGSSAYLDLTLDGPVPVDPDPRAPQITALQQALYG